LNKWRSLALDGAMVRRANLAAQVRMPDPVLVGAECDTEDEMMDRLAHEAQAAMAADEVENYARQYGVVPRD
jgi:hypothetical protein